ncbi:MAG: hypothetical protein ACK5SX_09280 [Sandaracinobacter sp.]
MAGKKSTTAAAGRATRPVAERTDPIRDGFTLGGLGGGGEDVGKGVVEAVRAGYEVIGENLRQGRLAAERMAAGRYELSDTPEELSVLGNRLVALGRELSTVWFDLVGAVLRDPALKDALRPLGTTVAAPRHAAATAKAGPMLTIAFTGPDRARARPVPMTVAERPASLVTAGFHPLRQGPPPLTRVRFTSAGDGEGIVAIVELPEDQPGGRYTGTVCDAASGEPVAAVTIEIAS